MVVDLEKFARDLAFEIQLGGDRFDKKDLEDMLLGIPSESLAAFREDVKREARDFLPPPEVATPEENAEFVDKQLVGWLNGVTTREQIEAVFADNGKVFELFDKVHAAYPYAVDSKRAITGRVAEDFAGPAFWSKEFPVDVCGYPEIEAVTFIDFKDCTNAYLLCHDGSSKLLDVASHEEIYAVSRAVDDRVRNLEEMKARNGFSLSNVYHVDRGMLTLMVDDLNRRMMVHRVGEELPEGVGIEDFVGRKENVGTYLFVSGVQRDDLSVRLCTGGCEVSSFFPNKGTREDFEKFMREATVRMYSMENVEAVKADLGNFRRESLGERSGVKLN